MLLFLIKNQFIFINDNVFITTYFYFFFFFLIKNSFLILFYKKKNILKKVLLNFYFNNYIFYKKLFQDIYFSKKNIYIQFFIINNDIIGKKLFNLLKYKSYKCIIYLITDEIGTFYFIKKYKIIFFNKKLFNINTRNHKKILLIDNYIFWIGGNNIGLEYLSKKLLIGIWKDFHLKFFYFNFLNTFLLDFYLLKKKLPIFNIKNVNISKYFFILNNFNFKKIFFINIKKIIIITPYIIFDKKILKIIFFFKNNLLKINIFLSIKTDNIFTHLTSIIFFKFIKKINFKVYFLKIGFNHRKIYLFDNKILIVGSINFDIRSFFLNLENNILISNKTYINNIIFFLKYEIYNFFFLNFNKKKILLKFLFLISFLNYIIL